MPTQLAPQPTLRFDHRAERIAFFGTPAIAVPTLEALAQSSLRPIAVVTEPDKPAGRGYQLTGSPVKQAAERLGVAVSQPATPAELYQVVAALRPTLGVVVAYGRILKPELLAIPDHGFVNLHFSLLPRYRGATPIQAAILNGDTEAGVSLMRIDPGLDTGPIIGYAPTPIEPADTAGTLAARLADVAAALATALVPDYLAGSIVERPQPPSDEPITTRLSKTDGQIEWRRPARELERFIRAMTPWPRAWTELAGVRLIVHAAHLEGDRLAIDRIQPANRRPMSLAEFARGYPTALTALMATGTVAPLQSR